MRRGRVCLRSVVSEAVRQYHADWHAGEEAARMAVFPASLRAADWAHFMGATSRGRKASASADDGESLWRTGVLATVRQHCAAPSSADSLVEYVQRWLCLSRTVPTLHLFHTIWHHVLSELAQRGEAGVSRALQHHYFMKCTDRAELSATWGMDSWVGDSHFVWSRPELLTFIRMHPGFSTTARSHP